MCGQVTHFFSIRANFRTSGRKLNLDIFGQKTDFKFSCWSLKCDFDFSLLNLYLVKKGAIFENVEDLKNAMHIVLITKSSHFRKSILNFRFFKLICAIIKRNSNWCV